jgi:ribosomal protein L32
MEIFHAKCGNFIDVVPPPDVFKLSTTLFIGENGLAVKSISISQKASSFNIDSILCKKCNKHIIPNEIKITCGNCGDAFFPTYDEETNKYNVYYFNYVGGIACPSCTKYHLDHEEVYKIIENIFGKVHV